MNKTSDPLIENSGNTQSEITPGAAPRPDLRGLVQLLAEEASCYHDLLDLTVDERQAIGHNSPDELLALAEKKEVLVAQISTLETRRTSFLESLSSLFRIPLPELTISKLLGLVDTDQAALLREVGGRLSSVVTDLDQLNKQNEMLLKSMLKIVTDELGFMFELAKEGIGYSQNGKTKSKVNSAILDVRA